MKKFFGLCLVFVACSSSAALVGTTATKVSLLSSYNQYGGGDIIFKVENPIPGCEDGFWFTKSDAGYAANMSMLLSAFHAKSAITVYAFSDQLWGGSGGKFCKLYSFDIQ